MIPGTQVLACPIAVTEPLGSKLIGNSLQGPRKGHVQQPSFADQGTTETCLSLFSGRSSYEQTSPQDDGLRAVGRTFRIISTASYPGPCTGHFKIASQGRRCSQSAAKFPDSFGRATLNSTNACSCSQEPQNRIPAETI
jgi:hypothetical protein